MNSNNFRGEYSFTVGMVAYTTLLNMNSLRILCAKEKIKISDLDKFLTENPFDSVPAMVYYGIQNYNVKNSMEQDLPDFETFCAQSLDEEGLFERMSDFVTESLGGQEEQKKTRRTRRAAEKK